MGGSDAPSTPTNKNGTFSFNGQQVGSETSDSNGNYSTSVNALPYQQQMMNYASSQMPSALQGVNTLDPVTQQSLLNSAQADYNNGLQNLNRSYNAESQNSMNDVARRFGGLNSSVLNDVNNNNNYNYNQGLATLSNDYIGNMQNYKNTALNQNQNYLNDVNNTYNQAYNQTMGYAQPAYNNADMGNASAQSQYQDQWTQYLNNQKQNNAMMSDIGTAVGGIATGGASIAAQAAAGAATGV